jgi:uncharacterized membrane protein YfcA
MEAVFGFLIALVIGMTGAGGGTLTVPVLVMLCGLPTTEAVGTSLVFATVVKLISTPVYVLRKQFSGRVLAGMLVGGLPGVIAGTLLLSGLQARGLEHVVLATVGGTIAVLALGSLWRLRPKNNSRTPVDRSQWLAWVAVPIGLEVGFSSAGASALGSVALLSLTPLSSPVVVGTDLLFGLALSAAGGGLHLALGNVNGRIVTELLAGGVAGALTGPWLALCIPARPMRAGLSFVLSILGAQLFWRGVSSLVS